jgi:hypothetical protein
MPRPLHALAAYVVITVAATWPLTPGIARDVAWDLGDSVLNMWIVGWDVEQIRGLLGGDWSRLFTFFDANIFHPVPLSLAYSEHLIAQAVQIWPVHAISANPILCYNLLFLSTFVLSGLGMYLFVRELTGSALAGFVAGLLFAFAPYRLAQSSHLTVLSSQWMPFVLYALRRYFDTRRLLPLAGAALAFVAQNLSCGYYLLYFPPFVAAYVLWEIARRRLWSERVAWIQLAAAGAIAAALTAPFLLPYARLRSEPQAARSLSEVSRFSADVYSYATAFADQRVWGGVVNALPKPEGELFPGLVPLLLGLAGIASGLQALRQRAAAPPAVRPRAMKYLTLLAGTLAAAHAAAAALVIVERRVTIDAGLFLIRMGNVNQLLLRTVIALGILFVCSPAARVRAAAFVRDRGFFLLCLLAALWLSLGPAPQSLGRPLEIASPYRLLLDHVPGFEGVRVPARFAMIVALMLSILAGYGAAAFGRQARAIAILGVLCVFFLIEATHVPFLVNGTTAPRGFNAPEARLYRPGRGPAVYREVARQASDGVLVELPLGQPDYDLRAMYYSMVHWRPLLNGYSGFAPPHYGQLTFALTDIPRHPEFSLDLLEEVGATHAIVHEAAYLGDVGRATTAALRSHGAVDLFRDGSDVLLALPRRQR